MTHPFAAGRRIDHSELKVLEHYFELELGDDHPLLQEVESVHLAGGEWLMHQGDAGDALYFLARGRLQAWASDGAGNEKSRFLNEIVPGDSVGEISLLTGAPRTVGIQATRDSLLVRIGREAFDRLALQYPRLALRIASKLAGLVQQASRSRNPVRNMKAISLLPLDATLRTQKFCDQFAQRLAALGSTLALHPDRLPEAGAPAAWQEGAEAATPNGLLHWLHDREDDHRFVIYTCPPGRPDWARFALRQSDLTLLVGDAATAAPLRPLEAELERTPDAGIARCILVLLQPPSGTGIRGTAAWLDARRVDFHVQVRMDHADDIDRVARIVAGKALGLVLAGGAARGFAHLGVFRALREAGIGVDWVGGTSIGAIMAAMLASPYPFEEAMELARSSFVGGKPFSDFTVPVVSLIRGGRMERLLAQHLPFQIEDLPTPFFCVSCYLDNGDMIVHERGPLDKALRASAAIPGIIPPAVVAGRLAVDGVVINNLPVDIMQEKPVGTLIAVDLSSDRLYEMDFKEMPSPWAVLRGRHLPFFRKYRVPGLATIMLKATELGTLHHVRAMGARADLLLQPPVRRFGMTDVSAFDQVVDAGYVYAREAIAAWQASR
jgi:NTE family protein